MENICKSFKFSQLGKTVLVKGMPDEAARVALADLGTKLAQAALK